MYIMYTGSLIPLPFSILSARAPTYLRRYLYHPYFTYRLLLLLLLHRISLSLSDTAQLQLLLLLLLLPLLAGAESELASHWQCFRTRARQLRRELACARDDHATGSPAGCCIAAQYPPATAKQKSFISAQPPFLSFPQAHLLHTYYVAAVTYICGCPPQKYVTNCKILYVRAHTHTYT